MFDYDWIEILNKGIDTNIETPTKRSRIWYKDTSGCSMFYDHTGLGKALTSTRSLFLIHLLHGSAVD